MPKTAAKSKKRPAAKKATAIRAHIHLVLDRSGSMGSIAGDVIGAVNKFIDEQKAVPGDCTFTLVQFDSENPYELVLNAVPIKDAKHLTAETYVPRGWTPLYDAVGKSIINIADRIEKMIPARRPNRVVLVIETDGMENASKEYRLDGLKALIERYQAKPHNWQIVFLGSGFDVEKEGARIGTHSHSNVQHAPGGQNVNKVMRMTSNKIAELRVGATAMVAYSAADKAEAARDGA